MISLNQQQFPFYLPSCSITNSSKPADIFFLTVFTYANSDWWQFSDTSTSNQTDFYKIYDKYGKGLH